MPIGLGVTLGIGGGKPATSSGAPPASGFDNSKSCHFDGVDDHIAVTSFNFASEKTLSYWIKLDSISSAGIYIFGKGAAYYTYLTSNGQTIYIYAPPTATSFSLGSTHAITTGSWIHIAIVGDGSTATLYKNGASIATTTDVTPQGVNRFGGDSVGGSRFVHGNMDEVAYWDSTLSASTISDIYNSGTPTDLSGLSPVHWWRMGDGDTFSTLTDHGSGSNNGTMTNMDAADIVTVVP